MGQALPEATGPEYRVFFQAAAGIYVTPQLAPRSEDIVHNNHNTAAEPDIVQ